MLRRQFTQSRGSWNTLIFFVISEWSFARGFKWIPARYKKAVKNIVLGSKDEKTSLLKMLFVQWYPRTMKSCLCPGPIKMASTSYSLKEMSQNQTALRFHTHYHSQAPGSKFPKHKSMIVCALMMRQAKTSHS